MKKSLKALFLCALTSLVMFAVVYASPIVAKAATSNMSVEPVALDGDGLVPIPGTVVTGSARISYPDGVSITGANSTGVALVIENGSTVYLLFYAEFDQDISNDVIEATYSISYLGTTYAGTVTLNADSDTEASAYVMAGHVGSVATGYYKQINDLKDMIDLVSKDSSLTGEKRVIEFNIGTALPKDVIATLANSTGVTVKFTFVYKGFEFCTTITSEDAKRIYNPDIEWYGPCFLAENCPTVWTGKTVA